MCPDYLTADELRKLLPGISEDCLRRSAAVGALPDPQRQPDQRREGENRQLDKSTSGVAFRVVIISIRRKLVDAHDNIRSGAKPLADQITESLGFASDDNPRLQWCYHQIIGKPTGTIVLIERV